MKNREEIIQCFAARKNIESEITIDTAKHIVREIERVLPKYKNLIEEKNVYEIQYISRFFASTMENALRSIENSNIRLEVLMLAQLTVVPESE